MFIYNPSRHCFIHISMFTVCPFLHIMLLTCALNCAGQVRFSESESESESADGDILAVGATGNNSLSWPNSFNVKQ